MLNNVVLVGRLTKDIEIRKTQNGKSVTSFTLAVQESKDETEFLDCTAWGNTADLMGTYLHKGSMVGVKGRLSKRSYEDTTGRKVYVTEVIVERVAFLDSKNSNQDSRNDIEVPTQSIELTADDLPF